MMNNSSEQNQLAHSSLSAQDMDTLTFAYRVRGWLHDSIEDLSKSIELNPLLYNGYYLRARVYFYTLKQTDMALQDIHTCLSLHPYCTEAYLTRANIYEQESNTEKAIEDFEKALSLKPQQLGQDPQLLDRLAVLYWNMAYKSASSNSSKHNWHTHLEKSIQLYKEAIEIISNRMAQSETQPIGNSDDSRYDLQGGTDVSDHSGGSNGVEMTSTTTLTPHASRDSLNIREQDHRIVMCLHIASMYGAMDQYQHALNYYTKAIKFIHEMEHQEGVNSIYRHQAYVNRGLVLAQHFKKYDLAYKDFMKALVVDSSNKSTHDKTQHEIQNYQIYVTNTELAMLHVKMNEIDKACDYMIRAVNALVEIYTNHEVSSDGSVHESHVDGNNQKVSPHQAPSFRFDLIMRGKSLERLAFLIKEAFCNNSNFTHPIGRALHCLDMLCVLEEDYENALKLLNIYIDELHLQEQLSMIYANRADAKLKLGKYHETIQDCNSSLEIEPNFYAALYNRGEAYYHLQELDKAKQDFDQVLEIAPFMRNELLALWPNFDEY
ncbi:hypothetical protein C9374_009023, partial [Naegleria lovaniensis]